MHLLKLYSTSKHKYVLRLGSRGVYTSAYKLHFTFKSLYDRAVARRTQMFLSNDRHASSLIAVTVIVKIAFLFLFHLLKCIKVRSNVKNFIAKVNISTET